MCNPCARCWLVNTVFHFNKSIKHFDHWRSYVDANKHQCSVRPICTLVILHLPPLIHWRLCSGLLRWPVMSSVQEGPNQDDWALSTESTYTVCPHRCFTVSAGVLHKHTQTKAHTNWDLSFCQEIPCNCSVFNLFTDHCGKRARSRKKQFLPVCSMNNDS